MSDLVIATFSKVTVVHQLLTIYTYTSYRRRRNFVPDFNCPIDSLTHYFTCNYAGKDFHLTCKDSCLNTLLCMQQSDGSSTYSVTA